MYLFSYLQLKISPAGSGRGTNERRVQSHSTPSEARPGSLWTCGPAPSPAATPRVCNRPPDCTGGSPHSSAHPVFLDVLKSVVIFKPTSEM